LAAPWWKRASANPQGIELANVDSAIVDIKNIP
jgi:hypothetical protein